MKVGQDVLVRPGLSCWSNQIGRIVKVRDGGLYLLRFRDGAELWYLKKELGPQMQVGEP